MMRIGRLASSILVLLVVVALLIMSSSPQSQRNSQAGCPTVKAYFCPEDDCSGALIRLFDRANESIDVAVYSFTHADIADALVRAKERGVRVRVILESEQLTSYSQYGKLKEAGIDVKIDKNEYLMHNKFAVIDVSIVATGSFNYTVAADKRNDENLVIIVDRSAAEKYEGEFEEMWGGVYGK